MGRPKERTPLRLCSKVATLYYYHGLNQQAIADRLRLSRPKVSRLLQQARDEGIVQITVVTPGESFVEVESALEHQYDLDEAIVVAPDALGAADDPRALKRGIGMAAADYLRRSVVPDTVVGVTWGSTLRAMMTTLTPLDVGGVHVVQTLGGVGPPEAETHAADLSRRLAQILTARLTLLPTPGIVSSPEARAILMDEPHVRNALALFRQLSMAIVGLGALETNQAFQGEQAIIAPEERRALLEQGAVGDIALRFFDAEGQAVRTPLEDRTIGITLDELRVVSNVVAVAGGPRKVEAIRSALKTGIVNVLITDAQTAHALSTDVP